MRQLTFRERYKGPDGPHLSFLTSTTRKGSFDPAQQQSIHPRVKFGRTSTPKSNTSKPPRV